MNIRWNEFIKIAKVGMRVRHANNLSDGQARYGCSNLREELYVEVTEIDREASVIWIDGCNHSLEEEDHTYWIDVEGKYIRSEKLKRFTI